MPRAGEISLTALELNNYGVESCMYFTFDEYHPIYNYCLVSQAGSNPQNFQYSSSIVSMQTYPRKIVAQLKMADVLPTGLFECKSLSACWVDQMLISVDYLFQ